MIPYKHYGSDIIEDVVDEVVGSDDLGTLYREAGDFIKTILQTTQNGAVTGRYQVWTGYPPE